MRKDLGVGPTPEVEDLARFLCAMGAEIDGIGTPRLVVRGVPKLTGVTYRPIPDRIEYSGGALGK